MQRAVVEQKFEELNQLAHWLKGAGGTAGFPVLTQLAKRLENEIHDHQPGEIETTVAQLLGLVQQITVCR